MISYVQYSWKDKLAALAILSILGVIVFLFGAIPALLVAVSFTVAYLYHEHLKMNLENAVSQREMQISNLRLQVEVARKAFSAAGSGPDGLEVVEDLLQEYGVHRIQDLSPADHQDFLQELEDDLHELNERRNEKHKEKLLQARHAGQSDSM